MSDIHNTPTDDAWPTPDGETVVVHRTSDTLVGAPPPPPPAYAPPVPPAGPPPDRRIGAGMLLALGAIALAAIGIALAWYLTHRNHHSNQATTVFVTTAAKKPAVAKVAVPRLVGMKEQQALVRLASIGLRPKEVYRPTKQPKGVVVSQKPQEATMLAKGRQVTLVIDSGAPKVAVPDVTGKSVADAQAALDKLGLNSTTTQVTSTKPAGSVVDQAPKAGGKLAKGSTVTLSVAKAPQQTQTTQTTQTTAPTTTASAQTTTAAQQTTTQAAPAPKQPTSATVPDVSSQQEASAVQAMGQAGILPSLVWVPSSDPLGTVESQAKPAGTTVPFHSHVQINLSTGPGQKTQETVPNVIGQSLQGALSQINGAHLRLIYLKFPVTTKSQAGKIVQQSPLGGGHAPENAQVLVFLGAYQG